MVNLGLLLKHKFKGLWKKFQNGRKLPGHGLSTVQCFSYGEIILLILDKSVDSVKTADLLSL